MVADPERPGRMHIVGSREVLPARVSAWDTSRSEFYYWTCATLALAHRNRGSDYGDPLIRALSRLWPLPTPLLHIPTLVHPHFQQPMVRANHRILEALAAFARRPTH
jgi:hypothetical protein